MAGFLDVLKGIAPVAASFIPGVGPLVGAGLGAALNAGGRAGQVLGNAAGGQADAQQSREILELQRQGLLNSQYQTQQGAEMQQGTLDLQRQGFDEQTEGSRMRRALIGQLLGNAQDFDFDVPGLPKAEVSGGLNFSALGQDGRDLGSEMMARALSRLREGNTFQGGEVLEPPGVREVGNVGGNQALNVGSTILNTLAALGGGQQELGSPGPSLADRTTSGYIPQVGTPVRLPQPPPR